MSEVHERLVLDTDLVWQPRGPHLKTCCAARTEVYEVSVQPSVSGVGGQEEEG